MNEPANVTLDSRQDSASAMTAVDKLRSAASLLGMALVPMRLTAAMREAMEDEGWQWEDLLTAAEAITEEEFSHLAASAFADPGDVQRYQRLRILGAAPGGSKQLKDGTVLRFQALDDYLDGDIISYPSRGEPEAGVGGECGDAPVAPQECVESELPDTRHT